MQEIRSGKAATSTLDNDRNFARSQVGATGGTVHGCVQTLQDCGLYSMPPMKPFAFLCDAFPSYMLGRDLTL